MKAAFKILSSPLLLTLAALFSFSSAYSQCPSTCELPGWQYVQKVTIDNSAISTSYTNLQELIIVDTQTPVSQGKMDASGNDIRFVDSDCSTPLCYYIENGMNSTATKIWVMLPSLPANSSKTIYMFYGSTGAAAQSNFSCVFPNVLTVSGAVTLTGDQNYDWIEVQAGSTVTVGSGAILSFKARKIIVAGTIDGNNKGNGAAAGPGAGSNGGGSTGGSGGGYGGKGGSGGGGGGGNPYGTTNGMDIDMGSGGGGSDCNPSGGGGGAVKFEAHALEITGSISVNGHTTGGSCFEEAAGGGSGGGILIKTDYFNGNGSLSAKGGNGQNSGPKEGGGGGGGGRIKVFYCKENTFTGTADVSGGQPGSGPQAGETAGNAGTYNTTTFSCESISFETEEMFVMADAGTDVSFCSGGTAALGSSAISGYTYSWSPSTGLSNGTVSNPTVTLTASGSDSIVAEYVLSAVYNGCTAKDTVKVTVYALPQSDFTVFTPVCMEELSLITYTGNAGPSADYSWDFGGGTADSNTGQGPHTSYWTVPGTKTIMLITDNSGCRDTVIKEVLVNPDPTAGFTFGDSCSGTPVSFSDNSSGAAFWNWSFGDNISSGQQNPQHSYMDTGTFAITQVVTSWNGCKDTLTDTVRIYPSPVADFEPDTVCLNDSTRFSDLSTISQGSIVSWNWNFGDGTPPSVAQNPTHFYALGSYPVTLTVVSDIGCSSYAIKQVGVHPLPVAAFTHSNACINEQPIDFSDSSFLQSGVISGWQWDFGDGTGSALSTPSHSYPSEGTKTVELIVTSAAGCKDTAVLDIEIYAAPTADFFSDTNAACVPACIKFSDNSSIAPGNIVKWMWSFGAPSGSPDSLPAPVVCYEDEGIYSVSLTVTSDKGCKDTLVKSNMISVYPLPLADFTFSPPTSTVQDMTVFFSDLSQGNMNGWEWSFFDNDSASIGLIKGVSSQQHPSFNFAGASADPFIFFLNDTGNYPVQLIATTVNGCKDTITKPVHFDGVFYVNTPNAFTPNGDGKNDFFFPSGIGIKPEKDFNFYVFDRWGDMIYESHSLQNAWDGTYSGKPVPQGVYVWMIRLRDTFKKEHRYVGHVTLLGR